MRALILQLQGTVEELLLQQKNMAPPHDENGYRRLTAQERDYRISRLELQAILGVSERTTYRRIKDYNIVPVFENGDTRFILGDLLDIISRNGLDWHRGSLNRLLARREIKFKPVYV